MKILVKLVSINLLFLLGIILLFDCPTQAQNSTPKSYQDFLDLGKEQVNKQDYETAVKSFTECIRFDRGEISPLIECYMIRGLIYKEQKKFDLAITDFSKLIERITWESPIYTNRGYC